MMEEIAPPRKRGKWGSNLIWLGVCSMGCSARDRIEQRKQQKTGQKTADMRLPGDADAFHADRNRSDAENDVDAEPDGEKGEHAAVAQGTPQRLRRHFCGSV